MIWLILIGLILLYFSVELYREIKRLDGLDRIVFLALVVILAGASYGIALLLL